jgi:hypothetical protein
MLPKRSGDRMIVLVSVDFFVVGARQADEPVFWETTPRGVILRERLAFRKIRVVDDEGRVR